MINFNKKHVNQAWLSYEKAQPQMINLLSVNAGFVLQGSTTE